ncbi:stage II sporulation protein M [Hwanghaeella sp.]|uniref:stage II sporulation protein M n=1 Tax=Hwanghaeella sp. TaxID=2605943 RepID=UPI003CCBB1F1
MADVTLKSAVFRREREKTWQELDGIVTQIEKRGVRSLTPEQCHRLPLLYRATLSSLSVARSISLDRNVLDYLETLSTRAYFCVHGARGSLFGYLRNFLLVDFPAAVRAARWHLVVAALLLAGGILAGHALVIADSNWYHSIVPEGMAGGRTPDASAEDLSKILYDPPGENEAFLHVFASYLFTHNAGIGILCFGLGFALGIPVFLLMFYNGLMIGAMTGLHASKGLLPDFVGWLFVHGTTELLAVALCAAAGLVLGSAVALPGTHSRLENLRREGRRAARIVIGAVLLFLVAALLEGFARQLVTDMTARYSIGIVAGLLWAAYFGLAGVGRRDG